MNGSQTRSLQRPGTAPRQSAPPADIKSLLNNEEQLPRLLIDHSYIDKLRTELTLRTSGCTVEQLEQINTHLMDCLWSMSQPTKEQLTSRGVIAPHNLWSDLHFDSLLVSCGLWHLRGIYLYHCTFDIIPTLLGREVVHVCFIVVLLIACGAWSVA